MRITGMMVQGALNSERTWFQSQLLTHVISNLGLCSLIVQMKRVDKTNPEAVVTALGLSPTG